MSKEEQIALELTKLCEPKSSTTVWTNYKWFLDTLKEVKKEDLDIIKLQDEIGTYKYVINAIKELIEENESNFVLKEDLLEKIGGLL